MHKSFFKAWNVQMLLNWDMHQVLSTAVAEPEGMQLAKW